MTLKMLHLAHADPNPDIWIPAFGEALARLGEVTILDHGDRLSPARASDLVRQYDVLLTGWGSAPIPAALAAEPGRLRYVCHITGTMRGVVPLEIVEAGIAVTNWGDAPAHEVAEGAMTLLLASLKELHGRILRMKGEAPAGMPPPRGGTLDGADVGIYGLGVIGRRFVEMLRPFRSTIRVFDPYVADLPDGCLRSDSLDDLCAASQILVIHAGLTESTRHSVTARHLARLPDHALVINTARGAIIDPEALFAELRTGRLRAGLDVTDPEPLPPDHPARSWPNVILTPHDVCSGWPADPSRARKLTRMHAICLENLGRFARGEPLSFRMDRTRYERST